MLSKEAAAAEERLRQAIIEARRVLTDEAVVWRAVAFSHDAPETGAWVSRAARKRADEAKRALREIDQPLADVRPLSVVDDEATR